MKIIHVERTLNAINRQSHDLNVKIIEYLHPEECGLVEGPVAHLKALISRLYNLCTPTEINPKYLELRFED
jgi:hypothetical protein